MKNRVVIRKLVVMILSIAMTVPITGCGKAAEAAKPVAYGDVFTDRDLSGEYVEAECVKILLNGSNASCDSDAVQINGSTVTISKEGTYLLTGTLTEGMILVDATDSEKVQLVLSGVEVSNSSNAAIYVKQADKVFVTLAEGTQNTLTTGGYTAIDDNNIDACIFSKCDLTVNGKGSLTVNAEEGHGIVSKDDLKVTGGNLIVTARKHGLSGKDSVCVADGVLTITAGKDGIHSENDEDTEKGYSYFAGGTLKITAEGDGISSGSFLQIDGGNFDITAGGGSANTTAVTDEDGSTVSTKGIKATGQLVINDGSFDIDTQDDSLHTNSSLTVNGGTFRIASGDDGAHADGNLQVAGGSITITGCCEGLEGSSVEISGGYISITAEDDGINAAGENDEEHKILVSGGMLYVNAEGDGIDANGSLFVSGGEVYVAGPTRGGNGALDYDGTGQITGGTVVALGTAEMAMNFGDTSTQGSVLLTTAACQAGTEVVLKDSDGKELVSYTAEKTFSSVVISCPGMVQGGVYTVSIGSEDTEIILESLIYGNGFGMGGFGGGRGGFGGGKNGSNGMGGSEGGKGERPELPSGESGERPQMPEGMEPPQDGQMPGGRGGMRGEQPSQNGQTSQNGN